MMLRAWSLAMVLPAIGAEPFECRWTEEAIVIDGKGEEAAWKTAAVIDGFGQPWSKEPGQKPERTTVRLLWDREWLYFLAEMEDRDVWADRTEHDGDLWTNDVFELFLKPSAKHAGYYEFEINAAGAVFDAFLPNAAAFLEAGARKTGDFHMEAKATVEGTLNQRQDTDRGWRMEGRLPWTDLLATGGRPAPGEVWGVNLARFDFDRERKEPQASSAAPLSEMGFHRTEEYASLKFTGPPAKPAARWKNTRLHGSPDGPPKYVAVRGWPKLPARPAVTLAPVPGGEWLWLVDQTGGWEAPVTLWRFRPGGDGSDAETVLTPPEVVYSIEFHPEFAKNGYVYFGANGPRTGGGGNASRVVRYSVRDGRPDPASRTIIIEWPSNGHNGAGVAFGGDGRLYVTSGDGSGDMDADNVGQNPLTLRAKVLRIDVDHPDKGRNYSIPKDNPFTGDERFAPETWAYGLRNPWKLSYDKISGQLWLGENGNDLWEMARLVQRGANYGWSRYEGGHDFLQNRTLGPTPVTFPTIEHPHSEFRSLTGGFVYRGKAMPELTGAYLYADFVSGRVRAAKHDGTRLEWDQELIDTPFSLSLIAAGADGEIVLGDYGASVYGASVTGGLYQLKKAPPAEPVPPFPVLLSDTGLFAAPADLTPSPGVLPYEAAAPGWHDGAGGQHHIALPEGSGPLEWVMAKSWTPANGTALAQTLTLDGKRIETRVLLRQQNDWSGYTYVWNDAQTDAILAPKAGTNLSLAGRDWRVPSRAECLFCHSRQANFNLTLHEFQLNAGDQLRKLESLGLIQCDAAAYERERAAREKRNLTGQEKDQRTPVVSPLLPRAPDRLRRFARADDTSVPVAWRARSYLGVNCAHCHTLYGGGNSVMDFDWLLRDEDMRAFDQIPQHGDLGMPGARIISPGDPAHSVLIPRVTMRGPFQMPPAGTLQPDAVG
ncbi:MAG TPA: PQQ-dependent sugar dehydrogenase, partial [Verrucomicrobiales bacterium]|nr:PQQ-dependent sugar dehydrogenase [Verrucomicrobiales bacterium]